MLLLLSLFTSHHLDPLSSAQSLIGLPLWKVVFGPAVGPQLNGLFSGRLVGLVHLIELFGQQPLKVTKVSSCPVVGWVCQGKKKKKRIGYFSKFTASQ